MKVKIPEIHKSSTPDSFKYRGIRYVKTAYDLSSQLSFHDFTESSFLFLHTIPHKNASLSKRAIFATRTVIYRESKIENV
jgi:hypothetical protein